ncbi:recombinase family protein [Buttiauxella ferragutiae]|uniref:recombinase family protein n=1 Tax=Buttiauxella ferragutiae TaxID=82989 RepID=UPI001F53CDB6|nr:recombinase family protein [Buttiauxella ferragutiae]UNK62475.1 recombinase family protein [Buttiauxella ferragutiae]
MSKSLSVTFRVPAELSGVFNSAVNESSTDKTAWLIDAVRQKLNLPDSTPDNRLLALVERMEAAAAALAGGKQGIPPQPYNEAAVLQIVADTIREGLDNGRIIAERLNDAGYQTKAGKAWDKDIYSGWKRQGINADKLKTILAG